MKEKLKFFSTPVSEKMNNKKLEKQDDNKKMKEKEHISEKERLIKNNIIFYNASK